MHDLDAPPPAVRWTSQEHSYGEVLPFHQSDSGRPAVGLMATTNGSTASPTAMDRSGKTEFMRSVVEPVKRNSSELSGWVDLAHTPVLLTLFVLRFDALVRDPVAELWRTAPFVALVQLIWCFVCLPPTGQASASKAGSGSQPSSLRAPPKHGNDDGRKNLPRPQRARKTDASVNRAIPALLALTLALVPGIPILFTLIVLFGAPITTHLWHTGLLSAHVAVLALPPLIYTRGVDGKVWFEIMGFRPPADAVWGGTFGALVGCWLGAIPIPLDWDREWQKWPVTIVTGAYLGYVLGKLLGEYVLLGRRMEFVYDTADVAT